MATEEKTLTLSLRKEILKVPRYARATKAIRAAKEQLIRHTKEKAVLIGQALNNEIHKNGQQNPPTKVKVKVYKFKDKWVADMIDAPQMKEEVSEKKKGIADKVKETLTGKKAEVEEVKHEKQEEVKKETLKHPPEQKKEVKEPEEGAPRGKKAGEREHKKSVYSKTQKPTHEKKK
jgi:ribosomal protein L31E